MSINPQQIIKAYRAERCVAIAHCTGSRVVQYAPTLAAFSSIAEWNASLEAAFRFSTYDGETYRLFQGDCCLAEGMVCQSRTHVNTLCLLQKWPSEREFPCSSVWLNLYSEISFQKPICESEIDGLTSLLQTQLAIK